MWAAFTDMSPNKRYLQKMVCCQLFEFDLTFLLRSSLRKQVLNNHSIRSAKYPIYIHISKVKKKGGHKDQISNTNLSGALKGLCRPCLGHLDKLSTNGCITQSQLGKNLDAKYAKISKHVKHGAKKKKKKLIISKINLLNL